MDTFDNKNYQRPAFSLGVVQNMHKIRNHPQLLLRICNMIVKQSAMCPPILEFVCKLENTVQDCLFFLKLLFMFHCVLFFFYRPFYCFVIFKWILVLFVYARLASILPFLGLEEICPFVTFMLSWAFIFCFIYFLF